MVDFRFNRNNTKKLVTVAEKTNKISKLRLDWLLDSDKIVGTLKNGLFDKTIFLVIKGKISEDEEVYKLLCFNTREKNLYLIEDIEEFLKYVGITELESFEKEAVLNLILLLKDVPCSGILTIENDRLYLYDQVEE